MEAADAGAPTRHACRVGRGGAAGYSGFAACGKSRPSPESSDDRGGRILSSGKMGVILRREEVKWHGRQEI